MEIINTLKVTKLTGGGCCTMKNYGSMNDVICPITYNFNSGNIYGLIGDFGNGGWALSYILSGKTMLYEGEIMINKKLATIKDLEKYSCYVGEDSGKKTIFGKALSTSKQIELGIKNKKSLCNDIDLIQKQFGLSNERFDRNFDYIGIERWKASIAIGYSMGKYVYCFPWVNTRWLEQFEQTLKLCLNILIDNGAIIIIPTSKPDILKNLSEYYESIFLEKLYL